MSCIRFNTGAQREQMRSLATSVRSSDPVAKFLSPQLTESKISRVRTLAKDSSPAIRQAAALGYHTPPDVIDDLAADLDSSVRECIARNPTTPCDVLRRLARDENERVRAFVAVNYSVPADAMEHLAEDDSELVRSLVAWKASLREPESSLV